MRYLTAFALLGAICLAPSAGQAFFWGSGNGCCPQTCAQPCAPTCAPCPAPVCMQPVCQIQTCRCCPVIKGFLDC